MYQKIKQFLFENQNLKQTIAKNTFWLFFGQTGGRLLRVAIVVFSARILGPESFGAFSYAMTLVAFLIILSDMGMGAIVTRELAKDRTWIGKCADSLCEHGLIETSRRERRVRVLVANITA